jgi:hypothetical protein
MEKETGFESISRERIEQVTKHRRTLQLDKTYKSGQLVKAAQFCISLNNNDWPRGWAKDRRDHIKKKSVADRYAIAGAFLAAEIDRQREVDDWEFAWHVDEHRDWDKLKAFVERMEKESHHHYSGTLTERACAVIGHAQHQAARAVADKMQVIEDMKVYVRGMSMAAEMVAIASTHGEKNARLRGMIELMNSTSGKLNDKHQDELLNTWRFTTYGNSDLPYQSILRKYDELKRENEELKRKLNPNAQKEEEPKENPF